jgi:hypothetical protein
MIIRIGDAKHGDAVTIVKSARHKPSRTLRVAVAAFLIDPQF